VGAVEAIVMVAGAVVMVAGAAVGGAID